MNWTGYEGRDIGAWRLGSFLGERDYRAFFVARPLSGGDPFLMQVAAPGPAGDALGASWNRARTLPEENLLRMHDTGSAGLDGTRVNYAVFDLPDDDLSEVLAARRLDTAEARSILAAVAAGLSYLHGRGVQHGAVTPQNVFLVGSHAKLGVDSLSPTGNEEADLKQFGSMMLAAFSPQNDPAQLEPPFREIALGFLNSAGERGWTAERAARALSPERVPAAHSPSNKKKWIPLAAAAIPLVVLGSWWLGRSPRPEPQTPVPQSPPPVAVSTPAPTPAPVVEQQKPDPTRPSPSPARAAEPAPKNERPVRNRNDQSKAWAVIAATYNSYSAAGKRASALKRQSPSLNPRVFPEEGKGKQYYVVFGSGLTQDAAAQLLQTARQQGAPRDAYVTKLER